MEKVLDEQDYQHTSVIFHENLKKVYAGYEGRFVSIKERRDTTDRKLDAGYFKGVTSGVEKGGGGGGGTWSCS